MQIGGCWFDSDRQELIDRNKGQVWHLSREEFFVLKRLIKNQNKVVSKQKLLKELTSNVNAELQLVDIIYQLRGFLGPEYGALVETVSDQGYLLHSTLKCSEKRLTDSPYKSISVLIYGIFTTILLVLMFWIYSELDPPYSIDTFFVQEIKLKNNQTIDLDLYPNASLNQKKLIAKMNPLKMNLRQCSGSKWDQISLSVSDDNALLNIVLFKEGDKPLFKNVKVLLSNTNFSFMNLDWLYKVGICER